MKDLGKTLTRLEIGKALDVCSKNKAELCPECPLYAYRRETGATCWNHLATLASAAIGEDLGIISDLVDDFISYVSLGVPNPAPYCSNACEGCMDARGWCREDRANCKGFEPNIENINGEVSADEA